MEQFIISNTYRSSKNRFKIEKSGLLLNRYLGEPEILSVKKDSPSRTILIFGCKVKGSNKTSLSWKKVRSQFHWLHKGVISSLAFWLKMPLIRTTLSKISKTTSTTMRNWRLTSIGWFSKVDQRKLREEFRVIVDPLTLRTFSQILLSSSQLNQVQTLKLCKLKDRSVFRLSMIILLPWFRGYFCCYSGRIQKKLQSLDDGSNRDQYQKYSPLRHFNFALFLSWGSERQSPYIARKKHRRIGLAG